MRGRELLALSAFTGLGGLDLGLEAAGFTCVGSIEHDDTAIRSLQVNRPDWKILYPNEIAELADHFTPAAIGVEAGDLALLAGAPPCQPYSTAGMWTTSGWQGLDDPRGRLLDPFLKFADLLLPRAVVLENVPGFISGKRSAMDRLSELFEGINRRHGTSYTVTAQVVDSSRVGVPQHRRRAIVVALRDGRTFDWDAVSSGWAPTRAWDAIGDIERPREPPRMTGKWADLLGTIPEGQNYLWHTPDGGGFPLFGYRTRYWSFLLKLAKDQPAWTLPAQPGPAVGPFHWSNRPLTTKEMLALQTFPLTWYVAGSRRERVRQIGNATPPLLAETIGRALRAALGQGARPIKRRFEIELASHVPRRHPYSRSLPEQYAPLLGHHRPHPGSGLGPRPRSSEASLET